MAWKSDREDEFFYLKIALGVLALVAIVAGLIEWNARRQAAAMTRELMRPMTHEEAKQLEAEEQRMMAELMEDVPSPIRTIEMRVPEKRQPERDRRPLESDERCIGGQRFRRIAAGGWEQIGTC